MARVLVLEDDVLLKESLEDFLEECGFEVAGAELGSKALEMSYAKRYDVYLLDIRLPDMSGLAWLRLLREGGDGTPAMIITSANDTSTLVQGYGAGADDYIKKPFDLQELECRIRALLARGARKETLVRIDAVFALDTLRKRLLKEGQELDLNQKDIALLEILLQHRGKVVTKEMLYEALWEPSQSPSEGALRVYVNNLKKVFGKQAIANVRGLGYRFEAS